MCSVQFSNVLLGFRTRFMVVLEKPSSLATSLHWTPSAAAAESPEARSHWNYFIIIKANLSQFCSAGVYSSTSCLRTNEQTLSHTLSKPATSGGARTPDLFLIHIQSLWIGDRDIWLVLALHPLYPPPPLYERYKFRIGFNTPIPRWPTRLTQLLCWMCHTQTQRHTLWCNPIRTECWRGFLGGRWGGWGLMQKFFMMPVSWNKIMFKLELKLTCCLDQESLNKCFRLTLSQQAALHFLFFCFLHFALTRQIYWKRRILCVQLLLKSVKVLSDFWCTTNINKTFHLPVNKLKSWVLP